MVSLGGGDRGERRTGPAGRRKAGPRNKVSPPLPAQWLPSLGQGGAGPGLRKGWGGLLGRFLICTLHSSNFYMLPFWSPCHAISKTVFIFTLALLFLIWVLLAPNDHFYNVNLAQNLKTVVTFYWNVRLS